MSTSDHESQQPRRTAGLLLGGLAAGALLGAGIAAQPAQAAVEELSIKDQFGSAFTPGVHRHGVVGHNKIVVGGPGAPSSKQQ